MVAKKDGLFVATTSGSAEIKGHAYQFNKGDLVREGHALLKHFEGSGVFEPANVKVRYDVEQATKAPGEKRKRSTKAPGEKKA